MLEIAPLRRQIGGWSMLGVGLAMIGRAETTEFVVRKITVVLEFNRRIVFCFLDFFFSGITLTRP